MSESVSDEFLLIEEPRSLSNKDCFLSSKKGFFLNTDDSIDLSLPLPLAFDYTEIDVAVLSNFSFSISSLFY
jgi:hypothetical protein